MSAPVKCGTCSHKWDEIDTYWSRTMNEWDSPCEGCKVWDREYELYTEFRNYEQGTNEDRVKNINRMDTDELAELMSEICGEKKTPAEWEEWLNKEM